MSHTGYTVRNAQHEAEWYDTLAKAMAEGGQHDKARRYANIAEQHKRLVDKLTGGGSLMVSSKRIPTSVQVVMSDGATLVVYGRIQIEHQLPDALVRVTGVTGSEWIDPPPQKPQEERDLGSLLSDLTQGQAATLAAVADWHEERGEITAPGWRWLQQQRRYPWTPCDYAGYTTWSADLDMQPRAIDTPPHFLPLCVFQASVGEDDEVPAMATFDTALEAWEWAAKHAAALVIAGRLKLK